MREFFRWLFWLPDWPASLWLRYGLIATVVYFLCGGDRTMGGGPVQGGMIGFAIIFFSVAAWKTVKGLVINCCRQKPSEE